MSELVQPNPIADALEFVSSEWMPGDPDYKHMYLVLNPCDGYHIVEMRNFQFYFFCSTEPYPRDAFVAWARLPDSLEVANRFKGEAG